LGGQRPRCLVPTQAAADASPALLKFLQRIIPFVASRAGSLLAGGRPCRRTRRPRWQTVPQLPSEVDGISFTVHPLGSRGPSDPHPTVTMQPIRTGLGLQRSEQSDPAAARPRRRPAISRSLL